jgi:uncharacterized protein (TIGR03435 family)
MLGGIAGSSLHAQPPAFEVATVKIHPLGDNGLSPPEFVNGAFTARNVSMRRLLRAAYGLSDSRIIGPEWLDSDRYDLAARYPSGVPDRDLMPMLQTLLKDRFHIAVHSEMKEMSVFDMTVAKGGLKMPLFDPAHPAPPRSPGGSMNIAAIATNGVATMAELALRLSAAAGKPVLDKTNVEGRYGFMLIYTPVSTQPIDNTVGVDAPDFFTAVEQQLGLRLEPRKDSIEVVIVDHAERVPTEN